MAATYEPIATTTLSSAASSITFSSIASSWTDLRIVWSGKAESANVSVAVQFNGDTATNYSDTVLYGNGSSALSTRHTSMSKIFAIGQASYVNSTSTALAEIDIFSYAGGTYKTCLLAASNDQNGGGGVERFVGLWRSTSAITSVKVLTDSSNNFAIGTTATLYGIKAA